MSERVHVVRRRALVALAALAIGAGIGSGVPTAASAVGPRDGRSTIRLSVVPRAGSVLQASTARQAALQVLRSAGVAARSVGPTHPAGQAYQLDVPTNSLSATLTALRDSGAVQSVEPVHPMSLLDVPHDSNYPQQATYLRALDLPKAWDVTHGSASVKVAVIDTGVIAHPDLAGKVTATYNAVTGRTGVKNVVDDEGHGTMVASIVAADTDNARGIAGAGWDTDLLVVKVADSHGLINDADVAQGVTWAVDHGAKVVNLSIGGPVAGTVLKGAIARAVAHDVVVVAAAGNNGTTSRFYPAALPGVLAVGATTRNGTARASFSEHGSWVDVAAPGVGILGANAAGDGYLTGDGTSFAAPLVAAIAALVRASRPDLTAARVGSALTATASTTHLGFAHGVVDAYKALGYHLALPGPSVSTPEAGDTVGGGVTISATVPDSVGADHVSASLVGRPGAVTAPLVGGAATLRLSTWGSSGPRTLRVVACRVTLCSSSGTDVPVDVEYAAPVLTSPSAGDHLTASWTVSASAVAPAVRFLADGTTVLATDTTEPFSAAVELSRLATGPHTITAVSCDATGLVCDTQTSDPISVDVAHLNPIITALTPSPFSPNGDGVREHATLAYTLDLASDVTATVTDSKGTVVYSRHLGSLPEGTHTWTWNGALTNGHTAKDGTYRLTVQTSAVVDAEPRTGMASRTLRVDLVKPTVTAVRTTYGTLYPHRDGYRDSTVLSAHVSEAATVVVRVTKPSGSTVWSGRVSTSSAGTAKLTWRGASSAGHALSAGRYRFRFTVTDVAGNVTQGPLTAITVSTRKAVKRSWVKTLTADSASGGLYEKTDESSNVTIYSPFGAGALRFHASSSGQVRTVNHVTLPSAAAYVSVRVDTYGRGISGGKAYLAFLDDSESEVHGRTLSSSTGTHKGSTASTTATLLDGHRVQWELLVGSGNTYDVRSYTVTLTYFTLA